MNRMVVKSRVGSDGVLRLALPVGLHEAGKELEVSVELLAAKPVMTQEEWRRQVMATAGVWQGEFERPSQSVPEEREPLS